MSDTSYEKRIQHELEHGKKISLHAEKVWNWEGVIGQARLKRRAEYLATELRSGKRCLEIGCGTGLFTECFAKTGVDLISIDISPELLEKARKRAPHACIEKRDACHTGFPDQHFDVIVGSSVLHHLQLEQALKEIYRILKPKGTAWFTEPNYLNPHVWSIMTIGFLKERNGISQDEMALTRWHLSRAFQKTGFSNVRITPFDFVYPYMPSVTLPFLKATGAILEKIPFVREIAGSLKISATKT